jgi:hypothetical protein
MEKTWWQWIKQPFALVAAAMNQRCGLENVGFAVVVFGRPMH